MARKPKPKKPTTPPRPPVPPSSVRESDQQIPSNTYERMAFAYTRARHLDRSLTNLVLDYDAEPDSVDLATRQTPERDPRRWVVILKFRICGVDYCWCEAISNAYGIEDDVRVRQTKAMMRSHLKVLLQRAFRGWNDFSGLAPYRVKPAPAVPPPAPPPETPPASTSWRSKTKRKGKQPPSGPG